MFRGWLTLRDRCPACDLDYGFADPADGPAFFVMSGVGVVGMAAFMAFEFIVQPPIWVHFALTFPLLAAVCVLVLRPFKAWLVAEQLHRSASEAEFEDRKTDA